MENVSVRGGANIRTFSETAVTSTGLLLACGVVASPIYFIASLIQILARSGFDIRRHTLRLHSNGELEWIPIANFTAAVLLGWTWLSLTMIDSVTIKR